MTNESQFQSGQYRRALLAQSGKIPTNAAKRLGSGQRAKTPRDLLLYVDHAKIPLGLTVIKRHVKAPQKAKDGILVFGKPIEQIAGRALLASACSQSSTFLARLWGA